MRLGQEAPLVRVDLEHVGELRGGLIRNGGQAEHGHVGGDLYLLTGECIDSPDHDLAVFLEDLRDLAADIENVVLLGRAGVELLVALAARPHVHVEDVRLAPVDVVLVEHGVLGEIHATDLGAVRQVVLGVPRPAAGEEDDFLRHLAVGGTQNLTAGRTGR